MNVSLSLSRWWSSFLSSFVLSYALSARRPCMCSSNVTYQVKDRHLHHALVEVRSPVLDDLDGNNLLGLQILTLDDLPECALA